MNHAGLNKNEPAAHARNAARTDGGKGDYDFKYKEINWKGHEGESPALVELNVTNRSRKRP